jgi:general secretion pathway protein D
MKTTTSILLAALFLAGLVASASAQTPDQNTPGGNNNNAQGSGAMTPPPDAASPDQGNGPDMGPPPEETAPAESGTAASRSVTSTVILPKGGTAPTNVQNAFSPPTQAGDTNSGLRLNFRNAPLEMVLNYLSDAAGFIIVQDTRVSGTVTVVSTLPVSRDEAVDLLNTELNRNGYAAIRDGRTLTIMDKNDAKTRNIPVKTGNDPNSIPNNDEIATWIIPIRFVEARQLVSDLSSFVSPQATVVANEAGNSIVVTDTQSNIRHLAEIIQAVDNSAEAETEIRVFHLKYASPTDVATELGNIFPSSSSGSTSQSPIQFRGGPGGFGGGGGPGGFFRQMMANAASGSSSSTLNDRIKKETQVTAVADNRIQAVIVYAPDNLMEQIADMMTELDVPSTRDQKVYVYHLNNGDPEEVAQVLQGMFSNGSSSRGSSSSSSTTTSALMTREQNNASSGSTTVSGSTSTTGTGASSSGVRTLQ